MNVNLSKPQTKTYLSTAKFVGCAAGLGSGKTFTIALKMLDTFFRYKGCNLAYSAPTYGLIRDIIYPLLEEFLIASNTRYTLNKADAQLSVPGYGKIFFRSMTKPETIIGFSILDAFLDELDVIPEAQAEVVIDKFLARIRQKIPNKKNQIVCISSPEGFKYMYNNFEKNPIAGSELIRMSTYSNQANLPDDYISSMVAKYPQSMIDAYLLGKFVNIAANEVWKDFDRKLNNSMEEARSGETMHVGFDFNVGRGCAVAYVEREVNGEPTLHAVNEFHGSTDTPESIAKVKTTYANHPIIAYPDATGKARKSVDSTKSDISLLKAAGFLVKKNSKNPSIKDRVTATNAAFCNGNGFRRAFVNVNKCPLFTEALEHQTYDDDGLPVKDGKLDDIADSGTYPISFRFPIRGGRPGTVELEGV